MADTTRIPGKALVRTGIVTWCCGWHKPGRCCDPVDCVPCCDECPDCHGPVLARLIEADWARVEGIGRATAVLVASRV